MIEIVHRFGIVFVVTLYVTANICTVEGSPCRCSPCEILCPKTILCPPPITCPLQTCPVPSPCPQPPPCPPCLSSVVQQPVLVTHHVVVPVVRKIPVIENICCSTCSTPCIARKKRQLSMKDETINNTIKLPLNTVCNSKILKKIMNESILSNVTGSRHLIQKASETQLHGHFNVICSDNDLSYSAFTTSVFCQHQKDNIICYAFKTTEFQ
ncbi:Ground-like domain family protein [Acanthocheilonema viteae]|uniref:Ground-like domain-containing protein n=1 Tax=Acanthocheilonema viteae TaxID=6277 RepID=A0A498SGZ7_ACAVI|nr:unnamed protein product [Acanthocheilonema viteae]